MKSETRSVSRNGYKVESDSKEISKSTPRGRHNYYRPFLSANNTRQRIRSVTFGIQEDDQRVSNFRRMSAPELPPILDVGAGHSPTPIQGRYIKNRKNFNFHSDSSYRGSEVKSRGSEVKSPLSRESSGSSQGRGRASFFIGQTSENQNGYISRSKTWVVPEQTSVANEDSNFKLESINNQKNGLNLVSTPRSNGYINRFSSRFSTSSGNNNSNHVKKKLKHCVSDSNFQKTSKGVSPIEQFARSKTFIKRVSSDHQIKKQQESATKFDYLTNRTISIEKTGALTRNSKTITSGNINGMRRYSSTFELTQKNSAHSDDQEQHDDDSETESEKGKYILNWLIGVETEDADAPPEPEIDYADEPPQTDTAVHVVYGESSIPVKPEV